MYPVPAFYRISIIPTRLHQSSGNGLCRTMGMLSRIGGDGILLGPVGSDSLQWSAADFGSMKAVYSMLENVTEIKRMLIR